MEDAQSEREYFRVQTGTECRLCGVYDVLLYLTSNSEKETKTRMMTCSCPCSVWCFVSV